MYLHLKFTYADVPAMQTYRILCALSLTELAFDLCQEGNSVNNQFYFFPLIFCGVPLPLSLAKINAVSVFILATSICQYY
jgi:hypothetical protein